MCSVLCVCVFGFESVFLFVFGSGYCFLCCTCACECVRVCVWTRNWMPGLIMDIWVGPSQGLRFLDKRIRNVLTLQIKGMSNILTTVHTLGM